MDAKILKIIDRNPHRLVAFTEISDEGRVFVVPIQITEDMTEEEFGLEALKIAERRFNHGRPPKKDFGAAKTLFQGKIGQVIPLKNKKPK